MSHAHRWLIEDTDAAARRGKRDDLGRLLGRAICRSKRCGTRWLPVSEWDRDFKSFTIESGSPDWRTSYVTDAHGRQ